MPLPPIILTIAGSDSSGGAGVQADSRAIHACGGYATSAITAITAQNSRGVIAWKPVAARLIEEQIRAVVDDLPVGGVKTGLLPGAAAIRAVVRALPPALPLVVDPVIGSTTGTRFLGPEALHVLRHALLPRATLITPNWPEAAALVGRPVRDFSEAQVAAQALVQVGWAAVLLKGGHGPGGTCRDLLILRDGTEEWIEHPRIQTANTHGTGCTLSATIATGLARGEALTTAVRSAVAFLQNALRRGAARSWGPGAGPAFAGLGIDSPAAR